jgi:hypothetical protein
LKERLNFTYRAAPIELLNLTLPSARDLDSPAFVVEQVPEMAGKTIRRSNRSEQRIFTIDRKLIDSVVVGCYQCAATGHRFRCRKSPPFEPARMQKYPARIVNIDQPGGRWKPDIFDPFRPI